MKRNFPDSFNTPFEEIITEISNEEAGAHGDHLGIFLREPVDLLKELPQIIQESQVILTFSDNKSAKQYAFPESEPRGALLVWPIQRFGLITVIRLGAQNSANELISAYPWVSEGVQHPVRLQKIRLWPNRLEAQIQGALGTEEEMTVTFFDPLFAANRIFYKKDEFYQFILAGFPYTLEITHSEPITISGQDKVRRLRSAMYANDPEQRDSQELLVFQTKGMAALLSRDDLDPDDYEFQGPVKSVAELHAKILGQRVWRIRITINRLCDKDFDIDLYLTEKVLGNYEMPEVGDDVRGVLWLQGYLWMPGLG